MPLFSRAKNLEISGGTFAERLNIVNYFPGRHNGIDALKEASETDAAYNPAARTEAPRCHPGTREKFVKELVQWATPSALSINPPPLSWMKGYAGVGKSAIAQTCVDRLKHKSIPCASFFFSINGRTDPGRLFPTIAYQLSLAIPDYRDILNERISGDKSVLSKPLQVQFQGLITEPLQEVMKKRMGSIKRITIFIDGLDECQDRDAQCGIVEIVADVARWSTLPLCWAFFSRPEAHIEATFAQRHVAAVTRTVDLRVSRDDDGEIERFLRDRFEKMLRQRNMPQGYAWPSKSDMRELVDAADGLFIYAGAASRFIDDPKWPDLQIPLRLVLDSAQSVSKRSTGSASQSLFAELDALYLLIMQNIPPEKLPLTSLFLTLLHVEEICWWIGGSGIIMQSNGLGVSEFQYRAICSDLCSVLQIRERASGFISTQVDHLFAWLNGGQMPLRNYRSLLKDELGGSVDFYHKSFVDFLVDPTRSDKYCISTASAYVNLLVYLTDICLAYERSQEIDSAGFLLPVEGNASKTVLSFPHTDKLMNSILPILVLDHLSEIWEEIVLWIPATCDRTNLYQRLSEWNFRKLYAVKQYIHCHGGYISIRLPLHRQCMVQIDWVERVRLHTLRNPEFAKFDVVRFKKVMKDQLSGGLLHESTHISSRKVDEQHCESGLFILGYNEKSIFWYWEINFKEKVYREFHAPDLDEGMNAFEQYHSIKPPSKSWLLTLIRRRGAGEKSRQEEPVNADHD